MKPTTLLILCAGNSTRFDLQPKKQWIRIGDIPLWLAVTKRLASFGEFEKIIVVGSQDELAYMANFTNDVVFVAGGDQREQSLANGLRFVTTPHVMVTDVARCCVPKSVIDALFASIDQADCIVPVLRSSDTVSFAKETIDRDQIRLIQTPQLSKVKVLQNAIEWGSTHGISFTDESSAIVKSGGTVHYIEGSHQSIKLTFGDEMRRVDCLTPPSKDFFVGTGLDLHPFEDGKKMFLGGVEISSEFGFRAHSDGDVLIHSLIDALLGACGAGDIGEFFPDTDMQYHGIDSKILLTHIVDFVLKVGYEIVTIDLTIVAQKPKISPHKMAIKQTLASLLSIPPYRINIKATTAEQMGFIGRGEGVMVQSSATLKFYDWQGVAQ